MLWNWQDLYVYIIKSKSMLVEVEECELVVDHHDDVAPVHWFGNTIVVYNQHLFLQQGQLFLGSWLAVLQWCSIPEYNLLRQIEHRPSITTTNVVDSICLLSFFISAMRIPNSHLTSPGVEIPNPWSRPIARPHSVAVITTIENPTIMFVI
jgi:hypothetical protein